MTTKGVCRLGLSETIAEWVFPLCLLVRLSATCHPKDSGPNQVLYPDRPVLRCCYSSYETRDSGPDLSFDIPASLEHASGLAHASLAKIEPTVTFFRVFQTLCKQGHWFSFAKCRAPSPVCIDDNMSCMKHWKSGFFLIDRRAIPDYMSWRHLSSAIDDPKPPVGSYNIEDVCRLSAHVLKLRDMPEGILILSRLSRVWKSQTFDALWAFTISCVFLSGPGLRLRKNLIMILGPLCRGFPSTVPPMLLLIPPCCYLAASTPSAKVMAKAESSKKQKALLFGVALSHVAKHT
ncbi:hypothetical protein Tco_1329024, partial [Tanacetum coccineum]